MLLLLSGAALFAGLLGENSRLVLASVVSSLGILLLIVTGVSRRGRAG